ncbi:hypothetical protein K1719_026562 [Acacia pycnantha]|nr:hypothetical protein K1719_026562 [Acacia pycnantha]
MGQHSRRESDPGPFQSTFSDNHPFFRRHLLCGDIFEKESDLVWPFEKIEGLDHNDTREAAYEIFFTACRSSPGFGGKTSLTFYSSHENSEGRSSQAVAAQTSKVKRALGLKLLKVPSRRTLSSAMSGGLPSPVSPLSTGGFPVSCMPPPARPRRPMTLAEIMGQQMRVTEQSDSRLRKTLMRTLVGQMGRRTESIVLPLELLRHVKPSEFNDTQEYHLWQKRQIKLLEVGLLLHPLIPIEKSNPLIISLKEVINSAESKPFDTSKTSDTMKTLCNTVTNLARRNSGGDVCHWADGFPLNVHLYTCLLQAIFDKRNETSVLDEVDELLDLMKQTWCLLGITRAIHNVCFTWVLFNQYIVTGQIESDLLCASHSMLNEVSKDVTSREANSNSMYVKILNSVLRSMVGWAEKRLLNYHEFFVRGNVAQIENILPVLLLASDVLSCEEGATLDSISSSNDRLDRYIRSSVRNAFKKMIKETNESYAKSELEVDAREVLLTVAQETEKLAMKERQNYSPVLRKWHGTASAVAASTLHSCYGQVLNQYMNGVTTLTSDTVEVLERADKLEKVLVNLVVENSVDCDDGGKTIVREMDPYEVDSIIVGLLRKWIHESLRKCTDVYQRVQETETWNPKSKQEPYAQSAVQLVKVANTAVEEFFRIPVGVHEDLVHELAVGLETLFRQYMTSVAACGSKMNYIPSLPPLTRCRRDSKLSKMWKIRNPCSYGLEQEHQTIHSSNEPPENSLPPPSPSSSKGTQRLYIRLNTLHYLLTHIHAIAKSLSLHPNPNRRPFAATSLFEILVSSIHAACQHVSEIAAYRLIFLDSSLILYESLYVGDVANASIGPALRILEQNLILMLTILTEKAHMVAMKEVIKATFDAFLMVLLAGGSNRVYNRSDHQLIKDDFEGLKRLFVNCWEGLRVEGLVDKEAEVVEGVIDLIGESTEQLMEDFSTVICETSGLGVIGNGQKLPMPPTTRRWHRSDPNTILRVLCHRNDRTANQFLKRTFQLARRK